MAQLPGPVYVHLVMLTMGDRQVAHVTKPAIGMGTNTKSTRHPTSVSAEPRERARASAPDKFNPGTFRTLRKAAGWTQSRVADALACDRRLIGRWELNKSVPPPQALPELRILATQFRQLTHDSRPVQKFCSGCSQTRALNAFAVDRTKRSGLQTRCRDCKNEVSAQWRQANRAKIRQRRRESRKRQQVLPSGRRTKLRQQREYASLNALGGNLRLIKSPPRETINKPSELPNINKDLERQANELLKYDDVRTDEQICAAAEKAFVKVMQKGFRSGRLSNEQVRRLTTLHFRNREAASWLRYRRNATASQCPSSDS